MEKKVYEIIGRKILNLLNISFCLHNHKNKKISAWKERGKLAETF